MAKSQIREWKGKLYYLKADGAMAVNEEITDPNTGKKYQAVSDGVLTPVVANSPNTPLYNDIASKISQITNINSKFNAECNKFSSAYFKHQQRYERIAAIVGVPPELIAVIHYRENTTDFLAGTFNVYLHNGDPLGKPTVHVPKGISFSNFDDAAVHAINMKKTYIKKYNLAHDSDDIVAMMAFAEVYNGLGYYNNGHVSPYLYSGTNVYVSGKYTSDGSYNPNAVDKQAGVYILLKSIL